MKLKVKLKVKLNSDLVNFLQVTFDYCCFIRIFYWEFCSHDYLIELFENGPQDTTIELIHNAKCINGGEKKVIVTIQSPLVVILWNYIPLPLHLIAKLPQLRKIYTIQECFKQ